MGIQTANDQYEINPISWNVIEGRIQRSRERFPWEHGSPRERWRSRIGTLLFGALLAWLVFGSNTKTITAIFDGTQHTTGTKDLVSARVSAPSANPVLRREPAPAKSPAMASRVSRQADLSSPRAQLGSYSSEADALAASEMMQQSYGASIEGRKLIISEAIVRKVQYYRVVIDLQSEREARHLCDAIKQAKRDCLVWPVAAIHNTIQPRLPAS